MLVPISILKGDTQEEKDFIPLTYLDLPVELIAKDGTYYMLWIRDEDDGEWWFVTELNNPSDAIDYVEGNISALDMLKNRGITKVVFRPDSDYLTINWDDGMSLERAQQELNLLLPTEDSYLELWGEEKEEIKKIINHPAKEAIIENLINSAYKLKITISLTFGENFKKDMPTSHIRQPIRSHLSGLGSLRETLSELSQHLKHGETTVSA